MQAIRVAGWQAGHQVHRVLVRLWLAALSGTPLQNNLGELFMLLHFLEPSKFVHQEEFEAQFSDLAAEDQVGL